MTMLGTPTQAETLRERAIAAHREQMAIIGARRLKNGNLRLNQLKESLCGMLLKRLDVVVTADQLHTISDGNGQIVPAWKAGDEMLFSMTYIDGVHHLCYVHWCDRCQLLTRYPIASQAALGDLLESGPDCRQGRCSWRMWRAS